MISVAAACRLGGLLHLMLLSFLFRGVWGGTLHFALVCGDEQTPTQVFRAFGESVSETAGNV